MKHLLYFLGFFLALGACKSTHSSPSPRDYTVFASAADQPQLSNYQPVFQNGIRTATSFFHHPFPKSFALVIHPSRASLDSCWQHDWQMPDFHSECWMVASGVASRLDMLSPRIWETSSCEHKWSDTLASSRLLAHEMVHVFHGQHNPSPDFSETQGLDWFVEGLAVLASGQCDASRMQLLRNWLQTNPAPASLDDFWTGKQKYGLSGSMVQFIDQKVGRKKLYNMLTFTTKAQMLLALSMDEPGLIAEWKKWLDKTR